MGIQHSQQNDYNSKKSLHSLSNFAAKVRKKMKNDDGGSKLFTIHYSLFTLFCIFAKNLMIL
jgi:hypothetical protein